MLKARTISQTSPISQTSASQGNLRSRVGHNLARLLEARGEDERSLAVALGWTNFSVAHGAGNVRKYLRGEKWPRDETLEAWGKALDVDPSEFLRELTAPNSYTPARDWRTYTATDFVQAQAQHCELCLNMRQALILDVLCGTGGLQFEITSRMRGYGSVPAAELARLCRMTLAELIPEVVDMASRSPLNTRDPRESLYDDFIIEGEEGIVLIPQVVFEVVAPNDDDPWDKDQYEHWCPPSVNEPRVLTVEYWLDVDALEAFRDLDRDEIGDFVDRLCNAAAKRSGLNSEQ